MKTPRAKCKRKKNNNPCGSFRYVLAELKQYNTRILGKTKREHKEFYLLDEDDDVFFCSLESFCLVLMKDSLKHSIHLSSISFVLWARKKKQSSKMLVCSVDDAEKLPEKKNEIIEEWKQKTKTFSFQNKAKNSKRTKKIIRNYQEWL